MMDKLIAAARVERARQFTHQVFRYVLGKGGFGTEGFNQDGQRTCDCSGYISEVLMTKRSPKKGRPFWIETTAIWKDATGPQLVFVRLDHPEPGCLVVYPDRKVLGVGRQGHIGLITSVANGLTGIDCSLGSSRLGNAVREHDLSFFLANPRTVFCCMRQDVKQ